MSHRRLAASAALTLALITTQANAFWPFCSKDSSAEALEIVTRLEQQRTNGKIRVFQYLMYTALTAVSGALVNARKIDAAQREHEELSHERYTKTINYCGYQAEITQPCISDSYVDCSMPADAYIGGAFLGALVNNPLVLNNLLSENLQGNYIARAAIAACLGAGIGLLIPVTYKTEEGEELDKINDLEYRIGYLSAEYATQNADAQDTNHKLQTLREYLASLKAQANS